MVQGPGTALRMSAPDLRVELKASPSLVRTLQRYLYVLSAQLAQTASCTRFHEIEARLARWLLMTHDRAHGDHFHLTHQFLANMLGVQRSAVTIAAGGLQGRGLIRYTRGEIRILDRAGLEGAGLRVLRGGGEGLQADLRFGLNPSGSGGGESWQGSATRRARPEYLR